MLASVPGRIPLPVAVNVETTSHDPPLNWPLPDRRANLFTPPHHLLRKPDIYRKKLRGHKIPFVKTHSGRAIQLAASRNSTSISMNISSPTRNPPASSPVFHVRPNSL